MEKINIEPIGYVKNEVKKQRFDNLANVISEIVLDKKYVEGLQGLKDYSHVMVVYWMNEAEGKVHLKLRPQNNPEVPEVGIFACRCMWRPNCIGISTVPLVSVEDNIIKVKGLDIIDKTPILDIKPYLSDYDEPEGEKKVPEWTKKLTYK